MEYNWMASVENFKSIPYFYFIYGYKITNMLLHKVNSDCPWRYKYKYIYIYFFPNSGLIFTAVYL